MVAGIGSNPGGVASMADAIFSRLDTGKQGYIDKAGLQEALAAAGDGRSGGNGTSIDDAFDALDGDSDGKITKSELTEAMTKLSDQLNAQFDAARVGRGGGPGGPPPHGPPPAGAAGATDETDETGSPADYDAAADTDGDGKVSAEEEAAYAKLQASGGADGTAGTAGTGGAEAGARADHARDPMRDLADALQLLKAYADDSGGTAAGSAGGISVTA